MSRNNQTDNKPLSWSKNLSISCTSAAIAEILTLPIDTIKVHIQAHQPITTRQAIRQIAGQPPSLRGFYGAFTPSLLRQTIYTGTRLSLYEHMTNTTNITYLPPTNNFYYKMVLGGTCGLVGSLLTNPIDVIKTNSQATLTKTTNLSIARDIYYQEGLTGFYKGLRQTAQRSIMISSLQLPIFFTLQEKMETLNLKKYLTTSTTISSLTTTLIVTSIVYPIDMIKTLSMTASSSSPASSIPMMINLIKNGGGVKSLYRGMSMGLIRSAPHFLITTLCYEHLRKFLI